MMTRVRSLQLYPIIWLLLDDLQRLYSHSPGVWFFETPAKLLAHWNFWVEIYSECLINWALIHIKFEFAVFVYYALQLFLLFAEHIPNCLICRGLVCSNLDLAKLYSNILLWSNIVIWIVCNHDTWNALLKYVGNIQARILGEPIKYFPFYLQVKLGDYRL